MNGILIGIIIVVIGGLILFIIKYYINKNIDKKKREKMILEEIYQEFEKLVYYRKHGTQHKDETKYTSKIFSLYPRIKSKKYNDIMPEIKEFGQKYKDSIPPGGANSSAAEEKNQFWQKAEDLKDKIKKKINED